MNSTRLWLIGGALAVVAILAGGWFLGAQPFLAQADAADADREAVVQTNALQEARLAELEAAAKTLPALERELASLTEAVPGEAATSELVGSISKAAADSEVMVTAVIAGQATLLVPSDPAAAVEPAATEETSATTETDASATATVAVPEVPGMVAIPVQVSATGGLDAVQAFIGRMQDLGRLISISTITLTEDAAEGGFTANLAGAVYVLPEV